MYAIKRKAVAATVQDDSTDADIIEIRVKAPPKVPNHKAMKTAFSNNLLDPDIIKVKVKPKVYDMDLKNIIDLTKAVCTVTPNVAK